ncbi:MAG: ABC transporter ATP-binding protein [Candidatus Saccharibacteria bacterium]|nr:ABC transporter ATP-binding protein [Candidatus Saccharibacteria bacterium]
MNDSVINISNVSVNFDSFTALNDVSAQIPKGKITGIIGPSGAGKTTLIRSIVGRQKISDGSITIYDEPAGSASLRSQVSYKTQEVSAYYDLTVTQNLQYFARMMNLPRQQAKQQTQEFINTMSLQQQSKQLVGSLSGGQKQRVSLAIALIGKPKLLVLDEPTVGLDPLLRDELWIMFRNLAESGLTLLISSHVMDEAERCDDLLLIRHGKIVAHATPDNMKRQTNTKTIEESFLKLVRSNT